MNYFEGRLLAQNCVNVITCILDLRTGSVLSQIMYLHPHIKCPSGGGTTYVSPSGQSEATKCLIMTAPQCTSVVSWTVKPKLDERTRVDSVM